MCSALPGDPVFPAVIVEDGFDVEGVSVYNIYLYIEFGLGERRGCNLLLLLSQLSFLVWTFFLGGGWGTRGWGGGSSAALRLSVCVVFVCLCFSLSSDQANLSPVLEGDGSIPGYRFSDRLSGIFSPFSYC